GLSAAADPQCRWRRRLRQHTRGGYAAGSQIFGRPRRGGFQTRLSFYWWGGGAALPRPTPARLAPPYGFQRPLLWSNTGGGCFYCRRRRAIAPKPSQLRSAALAIRPRRGPPLRAALSSFAA